MTGRPDPWDYVALLDALALNNVLALVRQRPGEVQTYRDGHWRPLQKVSQAVEPGHPWVKEPLSAEQTANIIAQIGPPEALAPAADFTAAHQRIAQDLTAMRNTGRCRTVEFGHGVYAQWADFLEDGGLAVEVPGNAVLPKGRQLSPEDEAELVNRAAIPPNAGNPNWSWRFTTVVLEPGIAAQFLLDVLLRAYHLFPADVYETILARVPPRQRP